MKRLRSVELVDLDILGSYIRSNDYPPVRYSRVLSCLLEPPFLASLFAPGFTRRRELFYMLSCSTYLVLTGLFDMDNDPVPSRYSEDYS